MLHHRDGRQELHSACHLAGDEVGTLLRGLSNLSTQDVQLLKPQTQQKVTRERPDPGRDLIVPSSAALNGRKSKPQEESRAPPMAASAASSTKPEPKRTLQKSVTPIKQPEAPGLTALQILYAEPENKKHMDPHLHPNGDILGD